MTRYARNGDVHIAYQVEGDGPIDLLAFSFGTLPMDAVADEPSLDRFHQRLASFTRLIRFDLRGVGLSDPHAPGSAPTLEQWMSDARSVLDAVGTQSAAVFAPHESSQVAVLLAASFPERVRNLVIVNGTARVAWADDYPFGIPAEVLEQFLDVNVNAGAPQDTSGDDDDAGYDFLAQAAPSVADDHAFRRWWVRAGNRGASPATARAHFRMSLFADVRPALPLVVAPTLVVQRRDTRIYRSSHGRYLADHIAGARYIEIDGPDHLYWVGNGDVVLDEIEEFLTGTRGHADHTRALATVLLTDIVSSTERLAEVGERRWRDQLDSHDAAVRRQVERFGGRLVKSTGDGVLATFDGPARGVRCALAIREATAQVGLEVRAGLHTGEVELRGEDIAGMAVHIAARVAALAAAGEVLVSRTVVDLTAGSGIAYSDRGDHALKGVPDPWRLFAVEP